MGIHTCRTVLSLVVDSGWSYAECSFRFRTRESANYRRFDPRVRILCLACITYGDEKKITMTKTTHVGATNAIKIKSQVKVGCAHSSIITYSLLLLFRDRRAIDSWSTLLRGRFPDRFLISISVFIFFLYSFPLRRSPRENPRHTRTTNAKDKCVFPPPSSSRRRGSAARVFVTTVNLTRYPVTGYGNRAKAYETSRSLPGGRLRGV